jgi:hypothetical protein
VRMISASPPNGPVERQSPQAVLGSSATSMTVSEYKITVLITFEPDATLFFINNLVSTG